LLLLDEPLAALDGAARTDVRRALREHLSAFDGVTLLVSHDPVDAATLAHRVVVLAAGRVVQDGAPTEVTRAPRSEWVARMLGWNACLGRGAGSAVALPGGASLVVAEPVPGEGVVAAFPPWAVALHRTRPAGSPRNAWPGTVREVTAVGGRLRVRVVGDPGAPPDVVAEATPDAAAALGLAEGTPVWASVKATEILVTAL
jgi:molybdate transport system permease protein